MAEEAGRFVGLLDQVFPFLQASPLWLKYWIYVLIFLNFLTLGGVAISYLMEKESGRREQSLKHHFSIDRPEDNQELPLGESQSWMLEGKFPVVTDGQDSGGIVNIEIEVFKMPERQSIRQTGRPRISTINGLWRFEHAAFAGEGFYEIIATATIGKKSDWRLIKVKCTRKAAAYKRAIERDREYRGVSGLVVATPEEVSLPRLKQELHHMQSQFFELYPRDLEGALQIVYKTLDVLDPILPIFPNDFYLQNVRAYTFKNYAMAMRHSNRHEEFERALKEAERMFEAIREQKPGDAGAWNGLGSVALLRKDPKKALQYIDEALVLMPDYLEAIHDRDIALKMLGDQEAVSRVP